MRRMEQQRDQLKLVVDARASTLLGFYIEECITMEQRRIYWEERKGVEDKRRQILRIDAHLQWLRATKEKYSAMQGAAEAVHSKLSAHLAAKLGNAGSVGEGAASMRDVIEAAMAVGGADDAGVLAQALVDAEGLDLGGLDDLAAALDEEEDNDELEFDESM